MPATIKENIEKNYCTLLPTLAQDSSINKILYKLLNQSILSYREEEEIKSKSTAFDRARDLLLYLRELPWDASEIEKLETLKNESFYPNVKQAIELMLTGEEKIRKELDVYVKQKNILLDDHCADIKIAFHEICKTDKDNFFAYLLKKEFLSSSDHRDCHDNHSLLLDYLIQQTNVEELISFLKEYCCKKYLSEQEEIFSKIYDKLNTVNQQEVLAAEVTEEEKNKAINNFIEQLSQAEVIACLKKTINPRHGFIECLLEKKVITFDEYLKYVNVLLKEKHPNSEINKWLLSIFTEKRNEKNEDAILGIREAMKKTRHNLALESLFEEPSNSDDYTYKVKDECRIIGTLNADDESFLQALSIPSWEKQELQTQRTSSEKNKFFINLLKKGIDKKLMKAALVAFNQSYLSILFDEENEIIDEEYEKQALLFKEQDEFRKILQSNNSFLIEALAVKINPLVHQLANDGFFSFFEKEKILKKVASSIRLEPS